MVFFCVNGDNKAAFTSGGVDVVLASGFEAQINVTDERVSEPVAMVLHWCVVTLEASGCVDDHADQTIPHSRVAVLIATILYWQLVS
jgi:hypothetical protein